MLYAGFGYWIVALSIAVILAFVLDWRGIGIWIGLAVGLVVVAALMLQRWLRRERLGLTVSLEAAAGRERAPILP